MSKADTIVIDGRAIGTVELAIMQTSIVLNLPALGRALGGLVVLCGMPGY